jgi:hypothetical protein
MEVRAEWKTLGRTCERETYTSKKTRRAEWGMFGSPLPLIYPYPPSSIFQLLSTFGPQGGPPAGAGRWDM